MQVQFELVVGENKFTLTETVENNCEFFKKLHFYSTLPKVGPNGETDLVLTYRVAQGQYEYYSIVSKKADQEFKFGQPKKDDGSLFGKGWEPIYHANAEAGDQQDSAPAGGLGIPAVAAQKAAPKSNGLGASAPKPTPAAATSAAVTPTAPPQVQNQAKNVLAKFGI